MLLEITSKNLEKYGLENLDANGVLHTIEAKVRALGHGTVTPADISNAFQIVMENKTKQVRSSYLKKLSSALGKDENPKLNISLEDFREISHLKEYNEDKRSDEMRHIITRIKPKITLDDVGGLSGIKENLLKGHRSVAKSRDVEEGRRYSDPWCPPPWPSGNGKDVARAGNRRRTSGNHVHDSRRTDSKAVPRADGENNH